MRTLDTLSGYRRTTAVLWAMLVGLFAHTALAAEAPLPDVPAQPFVAQVKRVAQATEMTGAPLPSEVSKALEQAIATPDADDRVTAIQQALDPLCIAIVQINPESRVKAEQGAAAPVLTQHGWTAFLVKVINEAGVTAPLRCVSPNAELPYKKSNAASRPATSVTPQDVEQRWLDVAMADSQPLAPRLSGLTVEYRLVLLHSRDAGQCEAQLMFDVGQGTQDLGFRNELNVLFTCRPAVEVTIRVRDDDGAPTMAQFEIRDAQGRIYPLRSRRMAPDFFFHDQIYRRDGESVLLPAGEYEVTFSRGPEYVVQRASLEVTDAPGQQWQFELQRWIKMADFGWYSGDHHVHAAGCAHYESPTEGVTPEDMMRHILGEDLNVGCVLSWGPCWYTQKQFFEGRVSALSLPQYLMRYDIEVSGFPSSHCGHLCLLRLSEDDYPGASEIEQWPSWDLPVLQWGKRQGGVVGFSHSGFGLTVAGDTLPTYEVPKYDGIGANEYIIDVAHDACHFISAVDTPSIWELNAWYHTLNCGYQCRISGETDFPCIYGERVGLGRSYVKLPDDAPLDYDRWVEGIRDGRSYVSEGKTHLFDFQANELAVGDPGDQQRPSVLTIGAGDTLKISTKAAALLDQEPRNDIRDLPLDRKPYWHVERARVNNSRNVSVELIVNGESVEQQEILADGSVHDVQFSYKPAQSSWVALRVFPAAHTNPIFVEVDGQPIRASQRSAQWCLDSIDACWKSKQPRIRQSERDAASSAYEQARVAYRQILAECKTP